ncbi:MAG: NUDIX domain-containing protein [Solirubrobacteraceae bacterium]
MAPARRRGTYPVDVPFPVTLQRLGYRLAYRILQAFWFIARPDKHGVKCLVCDRELVLLVRHTYGRRAWDVPGGSIKRQESPLSAARREMSEELGLDEVGWVEIGEFHGRLDHRRDTIHCFGAQLSRPALVLDAGELATAQWFARGQLPDDLAPYAPPVIALAPALSTADPAGP